MPSVFLNNVRERSGPGKLAGLCGRMPGAAAIWKGAARSSAAAWIANSTFAPLETATGRAGRRILFSGGALTCAMSAFDDRVAGVERTKRMPMSKSLAEHGPPANAARCAVKRRNRVYCLRRG